MQIGPITLNPMNAEKALEMFPMNALMFLVVFFATRVLIYRNEYFVWEFYWGLSEKYARSYVKPNKVVKFVRKCFGLETKRKLHWVICLFHYLQIAMAISPIFMLPVLICIPLEYAFTLCMFIGFAPFALMFLINIPFFILQWIRCEILKKTNPMYANRDFRYTGHI